MLYGGIDVIGPVVTGWAIDAKNDAGCVVDVHFDGVKKFSFLTGDHERPDVEEVISKECGTEIGPSGFKLDLRGALRASGTKNTTVELRFNRTGNLLPGPNPFVARPFRTRLQIIVGADGYRFYAGDRNTVLAQMSGDVRPDENVVAAWSDLHSLTKTATERAGGQFLPVVVPDKVAVDPQLVSDDMQLYADRSISLLKARSNNLYGQEILYPLDYLRGLATEANLLTKTDSHLSWRSQSYIFQLLMDKLGASVSIPEIDWVPTAFVHDLQLNDQDDEAEIEDMPRIAGHHTVKRVGASQGRMQVYFNSQGQIPIVFLCGHSSCSMLCVFIQHIARVTVFFESSSFSLSLIRKFKPTAVISYISERNIFTHPDKAPEHAPVLEERMIARAIELDRRLRSASGTSIESRILGDDQCEPSLIAIEVAQSQVDLIDSV